MSAENGLKQDTESCFPLRRPKRPRYLRWKARFVSWLIRVLGRTLKFVLHLHVEVVGKGNIPADGAVVGVSNHLSFSDPALLGAVVKRSGVIMAAKELERFLPIKWLLKWGGHITVDRDSDDGRELAFQEMNEAVSNGMLGFMYAEAGIKKDRWRTGPFRIAREHEAPILVSRVDGTDDLWASTKADLQARNGKMFNFRAKLRIVFLPPIPYEQYRHMTDSEVAAYCQRLCEEAA